MPSLIVFGLLAFGGFLIIYSITQDMTKLGTWLVLRRVWNPIDFLGQRSMSLGLENRAVDIRGTVDVYCLNSFHNRS
jgi:hypothetical protein